MVDKTALLEILSELPISVGRLLLDSVIVVVVVLVVDVVALWLLNLLWNVDIWLNLLFWEGVILMLFGMAGWWRGEQPVPSPRLSGERLYRIKVKFLNLWFGVTVGIAGFVLFILSIYLGLRYY